MLTSLSRDDWNKFTDYRGYEVNDEVIQWFWKIVRSWPAEKKSRLLQFATGTSRIPVNGFKDLQGSDGPRRFTIEKSGDVSALPKRWVTSHQIWAPRPYSSLQSFTQSYMLQQDRFAALYRLQRTRTQTHIGSRRNCRLWARVTVCCSSLSTSFLRFLFSSFLFLRVVLFLAGLFVQFFYTRHFSASLILYCHVICTRFVGAIVHAM